MRVEEYYTGPSHTRFGPYYRVVDDDGSDVPNPVAGVCYPADGFHTRAAAERWMNRRVQ
jgi:hypothetical protein